MPETPELTELPGAEWASPESANANPAGLELAGAELAGAELAGAMAAVLGRLWGALAREPIPGLGPRDQAGGQVVVKLPDGRLLRGDAARARPFAPAPDGFAVELDGARYTDPARLLRELRLPGAAERLAAELDNSVANLALARAAARTATAPDNDPADTDLADADLVITDLVDTEQSVVDGHPLHPCCRTRIGLSRAEVLAYAPEHRPVVPLVLVTVPGERWLGSGPPVLVLHPWQRDHILPAYPWLRDDGARWPARPLMSLRTLVPLADPGRHVKTAVDVQMTSAVRTVSPAAIHNGPRVSALLTGLARRVGGLEIMAEVEAGAVLVDGEPCRSLAHLYRNAPTQAPGEVVMPMAALTSPAARGLPPRVVELVRRGYSGQGTAFCADVARVLLAPTLALLRLGVALEAHGQNTLVGLRDGRPARLLYRDLGGVRVSPRRLSRHGVDVSTLDLRGDLASDDPVVLRTKLFAAAVSTVLGELVAVLARAGDQPEESLWAAVAATARDIFAGLPADDRDHDASAFFGDTLPVKAMTAMRLAADPLTDVWAELPNPMAGALSSAAAAAI